MKIKANIMDSLAVCRAIKRLAHEIVEKNSGTEDVVIVGILKRGAYIADRLEKKIFEIEGSHVPVGDMDITFYRDDLGRNMQPVVNKTDIPFDINGKHVILVDDVLYTGRTARAALETVFGFGRPGSVQFVALIDRGHRELPLRPDYVGKNVPTKKTETISVTCDEIDGETGVYICDSEK